MNKIKYVFWDSDNTLVNTAEHHWRKHYETLQSLGITLEDQWRTRIYTNNGAQNWEWISAELGLDVPCQDYLDKIDQWYFDHIDDIQIRSGITEALDFCDHNGIPQCVVSNGRRRSVMAALEAKNIAPRMRFILCKEDYEGRKPGPEPYVAALGKMEETEGFSIHPETCLAVEDDPKGVESAKAAGMQVIYRPHGDDDPAQFLKNFKQLFS